MPITTITSQPFNQDTSGAKKAASNGSVVITDRGRPAHVLLTYDAYQSLSGQKPTIIDLLYGPENRGRRYRVPAHDLRSAGRRSVLMFVLDTSVVSEFRKLPMGRADPRVAQWVSKTNTSAMYLSVITIMEIEIGLFDLSDTTSFKRLSCDRGWNPKSFLHSGIEY